MNWVHPFQRTIRFYAQNKILPRELFVKILRRAGKSARFTPRPMDW
jgi:hypothetical protein